MLNRALLIAAFLVASYFLIRWLRRSAWSRRISPLLIVVGVFVTLTLLAIRGGAEIAIPLLAVFAPLAWRWLKRSPAPSGGTHQNRSTIQTHFLSITFDETTGSISGMVRQGRFAGYRLQDLKPQVYITFWQECQADPQSLAVFEAYLDQQTGRQWREQWRNSTSSPQTQENLADRPMTEAEAYAVLGLPVGASRDAIQAAYRRLMQRLHPDQGGNDYLAACLNRARALLLENKKMI